MTTFGKRPLLIVISAPSGTGKTTLCDRLVHDVDTIQYSVSCTTRSPRVGEADGQSYHFLSKDVFQAKVEQGAFLEHACVHGCQYGTLRETVFKALEGERDVLMDIDVQGAAQIRAYVESAASDDPLKYAFIDIFLAPPSLETLRERLQARGKDSIDMIDRRMLIAEHEIERQAEFRYFVVNDQLEDAYEVLRAIVLAEHHRLKMRCEANV